MPLFPRQFSRRPQFGEVLADVVRDAPATLRKDKLRPINGAGPMDKFFMAIVCGASVSFCVYAVLTSLRDPDYFSQKLISSLQVYRTLDPITTGAVAAPVAADASLPVPVVVRKRDPKPADYQIVMVFDGEAILTTSDELMRAKVGTVLPGLGVVKEIVPSGTGGMVVAEEATLQTAAP